MKLVHAYYLIIIIFSFIISNDQEKIYELKLEVSYVCQDLDQVQDTYTHKICWKLYFPRRD